MNINCIDISENGIKNTSKIKKSKQCKRRNCKKIALKHKTKYNIDKVPLVLGVQIDSPQCFIKTTVVFLFEC